MREINPDKSHSQTQTLLLVADSQKQQQLIKVNRYLMYMVLSLMVLVLLLGFLLWPPKDPLQDLNVSAVQLRQTSPAISAEINLLKSQVVGLVGGSIDSKLKNLEDSVRSGSLNSAMSTIQDLKRDVHALQAYNEPALSKEPAKAANDILLAEVSHLKHLLYLTIASVSLMFAGLAGIWLNKRYHITHQRTAYLPHAHRQSHKAKRK
jgi:hypothetical protein